MKFDPRFLPSHRAAPLPSSVPPPVPPLRLLLLDDDAALAAAMVRLFTDAGFVVDVVSDGHQAADRALAGEHDLLLLDLGLAGCDGLDLVDRLRSAGMAVPILIVSARISTSLAALDAGADGFIAKPVDPAELLARARALLRRCQAATVPPAVTGIGDLCIDAAAGSVHAHDHRLALTARQFDLLAILARRPGQTVTRSLLIDQLYQGLAMPTAATIDVFVHAIRQQLAASGSLVKINTVRGIGFCLVAGA